MDRHPPPRRAVIMLAALVATGAAGCSSEAPSPVGARSEASATATGRLAATPQQHDGAAVPRGGWRPADRTAPEPDRERPLYVLPSIVRLPRANDAGEMAPLNASLRRLPDETAADLAAPSEPAGPGPEEEARAAAAATFPPVFAPQALNDPAAAPPGVYLPMSPEFFRPMESGPGTSAAAGAAGSNEADDRLELRGQPVAASEPRRLSTQAAVLRRQEMNVVAQQADAKVRHGFVLAQRGAFYSARAEFIQALRQVSLALDAQSAAPSHSQALAAGLKALDEVDDFVPRGARLEADMNMRAIVAAHRTGVLKQGDAADITPLAALQRYLTHAQEQLAQAGGNEPAASRALYALGRGQIDLADAGTPESIVPSKAMAFYQAALLVDAGNHLAANELGVTLARFGQYAEARRVLEHASRVAQPPEVWHNLAVVYDRLGETTLAAAARQREQRAAAEFEQAADGGSLVRRVDAASFAKVGGASSLSAPVPRPSESARPAPAAARMPPPPAATRGAALWPATARPAR